VTEADRPYYRPDLALIHDRGFGFHADACAPGILRKLEPVKERGGVVLEFGCGSGLFTRHLVAAGHRVVATDASPAMLDLARENVPGVEEIHRMTLPDDAVPEADAIVSVGHVLSYLPDADSIDRALVALARALRPGGVLAFDLCDHEYAARRVGDVDRGWVGDDWALVTRFSVPAPDRFVRDMATFVRTADGSWRRGDERHVNVMVDTSRVPALLAREGVEAEVRPSFGDEEMPPGLCAVVGGRPA
jgi:SAM-dependent methyltransferase